MMPIQIKIIAYAMAIALLAGAYFTWQDHERGIGREQATREYNLRIAEQKAEAARMLAAETARVQAAEKTLRAVLDAQEVQNVKDQKTVSNLSIRLRNLTAVNNGRLRDPRADERCGGSGDGGKGGNSVNTGHSEGDGAATGGLLSQDATGLFLGGADDAERISAAYRSCRAYAFAVNNALGQ